MAPARTTKRNVSQSQTQSQSQLSQSQSQALVDPKLKGLPEAFTAWANGRLRRKMGTIQIQLSSAIIQLAGVWHVGK